MRMEKSQVMLDLLQRPLRSLRLSVTDRCNLRCLYCMPEESYTWLPKQSILNFDELEFLARAFRLLGVEQLRLTGGEPLLRRDLPVLVQKLSAIGFEDLAITTNGTLLADLAPSLFEAGLDRVTVSLDAVDHEVFEKMSQRKTLPKVMKGLEAVAGTPGLKLDSVIVKGMNESQIIPLLKLGEKLKAEVRFIEFMDVGGATNWDHQKVFSRAEILEHLGFKLGTVSPLPNRGSAPAERFQLESGQIFGIISSTTQPFCQSCDRVRVTADGKLFTCLYARTGVDLKNFIRPTRSVEKLRSFLSSHWRARNDREAERRHGLSDRGPAFSLRVLQENPHLEMHTRGG